MTSLKELRQAYCTWPKPKVKDILWVTRLKDHMGIETWKTCTYACFIQKHENAHTCLFCALCTFLHGGWSLCSFLYSFCSLFTQHQIKARKNSSNYVKVELRKVKLWMLFSHLQCGSPNLFWKKSTMWKLNYRHLNYLKWTCIRYQKSQICTQTPTWKPHTIFWKWRIE